MIRADRDLLAGQALGSPVLPLVVGRDQVGHGCGETEEHVGADGGVGTQRPLRVVEGVPLLQHAVQSVDLADVVQPAGHGDLGPLLRG